MENLKLKSTEILVIRTCKDDGASHNGFKWPASGYVECPDWDPTPVCGHGLHGLPWGVGRSAYLGWNSDANNGWVVKVDTSKDYVHGEGEFYDKCKFKSGEVILSNAYRTDCIDLITRYAPKDSKINWTNQVGHNNSTQIAGSCAIQSANCKATQTADNDSIQNAGYYSTQTAGHCSTQTAKDYSTQKAGNHSTQTGGYDSVQIAGAYSNQAAGGSSTQKAGYKSTQTAGDWSNQMAGECSTQTTGNQSFQKAGKKTVQICRWGLPSNVAVRTIDETTADQWFYVEYGVWRLATENEIKSNMLI